MSLSANPFGRDADGNPRVIAVLLGGPQEGLVVWHSPQEYTRLWAGVDKASASCLGSPSDPGSNRNRGIAT